MALRLVYVAEQLILVAGYESGHAKLYQQAPSQASINFPARDALWKCIYSYKAHTQPSKWRLLLHIREHNLTLFGECSIICGLSLVLVFRESAIFFLILCRWHTCATPNIYVVSI